MPPKPLLPFEIVKRTVLVKKESSPTKHGVVPEQRQIRDYLKLGVINLDKPRGPSSHQVSDYVKRITGSKKAGHSGTLDPNVTGVLPVALDDATKALISLLSAGKEYVCSMHMHKEVSEKDILAVFKKFTGTIKQLPPIHSAVKRQLRERTIYYLELIEIKGQEVLFRVGCQAGTYIRKLCHDMGESMGIGAHMAELRRTKAGPLHESTITTLHDLADAYHYFKEKGDERRLRELVIPVEAAISHLPKIVIADNVIYPLTHGATVHAPGVVSVESGIKKGDQVAVMSLKKELVALATVKMSSEQIIKAKNGAVAKSDRVVMDPNLYPKMGDKPE